MASSTTNLPPLSFKCYVSRDSIIYPFHPDYVHGWQRGRKDVVMITGGDEALALYLTPAMVNSLGTITNRRLFTDAATVRPSRRDRNKTIEVYSDESVATIDILLRTAQGRLRSKSFPWRQLRECLRFCRRATLSKSILHAIMDDAIPNLKPHDLFPALVFFSGHNYLPGALRVLRQGWRAEAPVRGHRVCIPLRPNKEGQEWTSEQLQLFPAHWSSALSVAERATQVQFASIRADDKLYWEKFCLSFRHHLSQTRHGLSS